MTSLIHDSSEGVWRLNCSGKQEAKGKLICAGYQSACLVILVIQQENTRYQYFPVWQDQISSSDFSYLQHQMLFNTSVPSRQSLKKRLMQSEKNR
ncbi:hypothetical protein N9850_00555 [Granulosicoccus sp.]|nr:hypothetical protein [Granulosicoccus sp.]MDB4222233.1 hypothetical protein [Granulosicoccus sp.]